MVEVTQGGRSRGKKIKGSQTVGKDMFTVVIVYDEDLLLTLPPRLPDRKSKGEKDMITVLIVHDKNVLVIPTQRDNTLDEKVMREGYGRFQIRKGIRIKRGRFGWRRSPRKPDVLVCVAVAFYRVATLNSKEKFCPPTKF